MQTHPRTISAAWPREHKPLAGPRIMRQMVVGFGRREPALYATEPYRDPPPGAIVGGVIDAVVGMVGYVLLAVVVVIAATTFSVIAAVEWVMRKGKDKQHEH